MMMMMMMNNSDFDNFEQLRTWDRQAAVGARMCVQVTRLHIIIIIIIVVIIIIIVVLIIIIIISIIGSPDF